MHLPGRALWDAFADGARVVEDTGWAETVRCLDASPITLPTGRIVASDPLLYPWMQPFSVRIPPGTYPVLLSLIRNDVAAIMVSFGEDAPVAWRAARPPSFGVDSATGCLMDAKVSRFLRRKADAGKYEQFGRRFREALDQNDGLYGDHIIDTESGANVILFHTWGGDCHPASYFGYSADGAVSCLVTDMYLGYERVVAVQLPEAEA